MLTIIFLSIVRLVLMLSFVNEEAEAQIVEKKITNAPSLCGSKFEIGTRLSHHIPHLV